MCSIRHTHRRLWPMLALLSLLPTLKANGGERQDSTRTMPALAFRLAPQRVLALDQYVKTWLKDRQTFSASAEVQFDTYKRFVEQGKHSAETTSDEDEEAYARDYNYPTFSFGLRYNFNHGTTMHRDAADWGEQMEVAYTTRLGDILTLYGRFDRPILRTRRWKAGYYIGTGLGIAMSHYDKERHIDNEFIGTRFNIYFTAGLFVDYRLDRHTSIEAGLDFAHHSNGALYRPNKGANYLGPFIGLVYSPQEYKENTTPRTSATTSDASNETPHASTPASMSDWKRHPWQVEMTLGMGAKSLNEDWQRTQFQTQPTDPDYRTEDFSVYGAFSLQTDVLYRYARRWATGLGIDVFYGDYASKVARMEGNENDQVSPWSLGLAVKHEAYYGRLTARVGLGYYLFRRMGTLAKSVETRYYERVGLFYTLDRRSGLAVGFNINAHKTKADFTELSISIPIRL